jgi:hypothetical protein
MASSPVSVPDWFIPAIAALLPERNAAAELRRAVLPGGGNNRVFRADVGGQSYFVKWYFTDPEDRRDRLHAEWTFANYAWECGLRRLPAPIACDANRQLAIFEFLSGRRLMAAEIGKSHIDAAIAFLVELNQRRGTPASAKLPIASEACFSVASHIQCIRQRVHTLRECVIAANVSQSMREFIVRDLSAAAERVEEKLQGQLRASRLTASEELLDAERIISPSDFGFHNVLMLPTGELRFFDFEYAGWDDPAKTVCDFFSQVAVPAPNEYWDDFVTGLVPLFGTNFGRRAELLHPLYLIKWCCIVLNPLRRIGRERRQFSAGSAGVPVESDCLARAQHLLARVAE